MAIVARQRGVVAVEAPVAPPLPPEAVHLWQAFRSLDAARGNNGFGPLPISFVDMDAWQRVMQYQLDPWEVEAVRMIDNAYLAVEAETPDKRAAPKP